MVYVDLLDLGLKTRGDEDRNEHAAMHCAGCYAVLGGSYFYRGYACPSCQQAGFEPTSSLFGHPKRRTSAICCA